MPAEYEVLLLDFGGVCLVNPVELHHKAESKLGLPPGTFQWMGPIRPEADALWLEMTQGGGITEPEYWTRRAADVGAASGRQMTLREYMSLLFDPPTPEMIRPEATAITLRALAAGYGVSILTNDMRAFHGAAWEHDVEFLSLVDHVIDCSDTQILKPDPRAFHRAQEIVKTSPDRILFVDDQPKNVEGARACGIASIWFDIAHAAASWADIARALGISGVTDD